MVESGIYGWQLNRAQKSSSSGSVALTNNRVNNEFQALQLPHVVGCFYLWFIGFGVAICALIYEICSNKFNCMKRTLVGYNVRRTFLNARPSSLY